MKQELIKILTGYQNFRQKYVLNDSAVMQTLSHDGQQPRIMVVACCDSRVDPAVILQCDPGDLFVIRNVANIIPPYERDEAHHGTSAALEFGIRFLKVKHLILFGHSQCGGIQALLNENTQPPANDFISSWMSLVKTDQCHTHSVDDYAQQALLQSHKNCLTFPWIKERLEAEELLIHLWFFDIKRGQIFAHTGTEAGYQPLALGE